MRYEEFQKTYPNVGLIEDDIPAIAVTNKAKTLFRVFKNVHLDPQLRVTLLNMANASDDEEMVFPFVIPSAEEKTADVVHNDGDLKTENAERPRRTVTSKRSNRWFFVIGMSLLSGVLLLTCGGNKGRRGRIRRKVSRMFFLGRKREGLVL
jgi:hypothetical protein